MEDSKSQDFLKEVWWVLLLRGIVTLLFGLVAISWPGITLVILVKIFALYVVVSGSISIILGLMGIGKKKTWWLDIIKGLIAIAIGLFALNHIGFTSVFLAVLIGVFAIIEGIVDLVSLYEYRKNIDHRFLLGLSGVISILFGIIIILNPIVATVIYIWVIGLMSLILGPVLIVMAFKARKEYKKIEKAAAK
jgi:uncharacterized membrane protein HdeD (DUF308 family)